MRYNHIILFFCSVWLWFLISACSENNNFTNIPDNDSTDGTGPDITIVLEVYLVSGGIPVKDVLVSCRDTTIYTDTAGYFCIRKDSGSFLTLIFEHPGYEKDSLLLTFLRDTIVYFELTPYDDSIADYYPSLLNYTWKYRYSHKFYPDGVGPPLALEYIIEREIIAFDNTQAISALHKYGMEIIPPDTSYFDSTYQYTEYLYENGKVLTFHEVFRPVTGLDHPVLNKYMEEGLNEGRTDIEFTTPLISKEYISDTPLSGTLCLYSNYILLWQYHPLELSEIYLADDIGLVKLHLEFWGLVDNYYWDIELVDFYEN